MHGRRYSPGTHQASGSGELTSRRGPLAWWQRRSWRMDLAVLARVRDGLKALDAEPGGQAPADDQGSASIPPDDQGPASVPLDGQVPASGLPGGQAGLSAPPGDPPTPGTEIPSSAEPPAQDEAAVALPDSAIASIRDTFTIIDAAGDDPAGYFYGWLFARQPGLRGMFPPAMDVQRDRLWRALTRIVDSLGSPEDLVQYLSQLGRDHRKYSVEPAMYDVVGQALTATLRAYAGQAFTPEAEEAWGQVYRAASALMIRAAEDDSAVAPAYWTAEVVGNEQRRPGIAVLTVAPDLPFSYLPGQHVTVQTPRWPRVWRPYSVANRIREDGLLTFHVKAVPGGWVSNALVHYTAPGDELVLGPPLGTMTLGLAEQRDLLCVAGGTGLSPIKAIIEQAIRESAACPRQIFLFYGARTRDELYDLPDLYRLADAYPRFQLTPVTSDDPVFDGMQGNVGRVAARYLPHRECEAYVAGPVAMVRETIRVLARAGIPPERIHYDDALLAGDPHAGPRPPRGEAGTDDGNGQADARDAAAETATRDEPARDGGTASGAEGGPAEREHVLAGRPGLPPG